jgi:DNA-binding NarL/FixJ family response regulator
MVALRKRLTRKKPMSKRLLVVDDEPNLLRAVAACLKAEGYEVSTARSGREALVQLAESVPDLVVSDIRMPGMDGYQLARQLRGAPRTALVPIVFLTAKDETADRIEGFRAGVDAYLTKPFEPDELIAVVNGILNRVERTHSQIARLVGAAAVDDVSASFQDDALTEAEDRVALAVSRGLSNKEIAAELEISVRTVENHISHILEKKAFSNRVEIARYVLEHLHSE